MKNQHEFIYQENDKERLDHFLSISLNVSRSQITKLIQDGFCTVNHTPRKPSYKLNFNDKIILQIPEAKEFDLTPEDIQLNIVYEDEDLIVVNKEFGMVVHPGAGNQTGTLVNALLYHCKNLSMGFHEHRPGIVHRLDKDTGGLIVAAKTHKALVGLAEQFKNKTAGRIYNAMSFGKCITLNGTIENYITRDPKSRKKFIGTPVAKNAKFAKTHFKTLYSGPISIFELKLDTGRTHQIRVHLSQMGYPIINDPLYGSSNRLNSIQDARLKSKIKQYPHMFLFARSLSFAHPVTNKEMNFNVELPKAFMDLIDYLDADLSSFKKYERD